MHSVVLLVAMSVGGEAPEALRGGHGCSGCYGTTMKLGHRRGGCCGGGYGGCYGGCYGGGYGGYCGCCGGGYGGCYGGGYASCYGSGYGGCYGGGYASCYGSGYGGGYGGGYASCYGSGYGGCYGGGYSVASSGCYGSGYGGVISGGCYGASVGGYSGGYGGLITNPAQPGGYPVNPGTIVPSTPDKGKDKRKDKFEDEGSETSTTATLVVNLPADAKLKVGGQQTTQTSSRRVFVTPQLTPGKVYTYTLKAEVVRQGQPVSWEENVSVEAGKESQVTLNVPTQGVAAR